MDGRGNERSEVRSNKPAALLRDLEGAAEQRLGGGGSQTDENARLHQRDLGLEPRTARRDFRAVGLRVYPPLAAGLPFEMLDDVGDVDTAPVDARTAVCMMTHDLKFDVPALKRALQTGAGYIGAIGSEKTRTERDARLRDEGVGEADLARLHAPIGIQIGARTPEEVAVTIAAQLIESNVVARAKRITSVVHATVLS